MLLFKSMRIRNKIISIVLITVAVFVLLMAISGYQLTQAIHEARHTAAKAATEVGYGVIKYYYDEFKAGRIPEQDAQKMALAELKKIRYEGAEYFWVNDNTLPYPKMIMHATKPELDGTMLKSDKYNVAMGRSQNLFQAMAELCNKEEEGFVDYLWPRPGQSEPVPKISYVKELKEWNWIVGTGVYVDKVSEEIRKVLIPVVISVLISSVLLILLIYYVVTKSISNPIVKMSERLYDISSGEGDLTKTLPVESSDEIGDMAKSFNRFVGKLRTIIETISGNANTVAASATELSAVSTQIAANSEEMTAQTATVASATEQAATNIQSISHATEKMSTSTDSVAAAIEEMSASLKSVLQSCKKELEIAGSANEHAKQSKVVIDRLGVAAKSIGNIVAVISEIAGQTKLLALNANIEAASAGAAGKGFTVVASEVKELATQTAKATQEIEQQVQAIQTDTDAAIHAIEAVSKVIEELNRLSQAIETAVNEQSATVNEIARNVSGVSSGAQVVSKNVSESAIGLSEVSSTISGVNQAVAETAKGVVQVKISSEELSKLSETLKHLLAQFKV